MILKHLQPAASVLTLSMLLAAPAFATEYADSYDRLCNKMKSCAMSQMQDAEGMTEDMKAMVMNSLNSMCESIEVGFGTALVYQDLLGSAAQCMDSMAEQSCESLQRSDADKTPQCLEFRQKAKKYE
ncbi:MAG: hypothetical protein R3D35_05780 [Nitratireductor sp.]